ncbi:MAG: hypothetical protein ACQPRI_06065, partial [Solitalea-like symbiont of Tyrophagus putrescentiae]
MGGGGSPQQAAHQGVDAPLYAEDKLLIAYQRLDALFSREPPVSLELLRAEFYELFVFFYYNEDHQHQGLRVPLNSEDHLSIALRRFDAILSWDFPSHSELLRAPFRDLIALLNNEVHQRSLAHRELGVHQDAEDPLQQNEGPAAHSAPRRGRPRGRSTRARGSTAVSDRVTRSRAQANALPAFEQPDTVAERNDAPSSQIEGQSAQNEQVVRRSRGRPRGRRGRPRQSTSVTNRAANGNDRLESDQSQNGVSQSRGTRNQNTRGRGRSSRTSSNVSRHEHNRRRQYNANHRANMPADERERIRVQNAQQHRNAYSSLPVIDRQAQINQNSQYQREYLSSMPNAVFRNRQNNDAQRHRETFNLMTEAERQAQRELNAQQHRNAYQAPERGAAIRGRNRTRQQQVRAPQGPSRAAILNAEGRLRYGIPEKDYLGGLTVQCSHCNAKHFPDEKSGNSTTFSDCCQNGKIGDWLQIRPFPDQLLKLYTDAFNQTANAVDKEQS